MHHRTERGKRLCPRRVFSLHQIYQVLRTATPAQTMQMIRKPNEAAGTRSRPSVGWMQMVDLRILKAPELMYSISHSRRISVEIIRVRIIFSFIVNIPSQKQKVIKVVEWNILSSTHWMVLVRTWRENSLSLITACHDTIQNGLSWSKTDTFWWFYISQNVRDAERYILHHCRLECRHVHYLLLSAGSSIPCPMSQSTKCKHYQ